MKNTELVKTMKMILKELQVEEVIICAGARNIPLVVGFENNFKITSYFEERSAAFYALGKSRSTQKPVVVVTTSGTAVAELLPAVIEAYYQNLPLIVITADRPKGYRGSGAPQSIEQTNIFQKYVETAFDWDVNEKDFHLTLSGNLPVHFNLCFDEPLVDAAISDVPSSPFKLIKISTEIKNLNTPQCQNPLVIISEISDADRETVFQFLKRTKAIFYSEFLSGLLNVPELKSQQIFHLEGLQSFPFESVIRIGGVPTHRLWRDLEAKYKSVPVYNFSRRSYSGLARKSESFSWSELSDLKINYTSALTESFARDAVLLEQKNELLKKYPQSEPAFVRALSKMIGTEPLYIGNSLPIREWDLFSETIQKQQKTFAHRGANGIDGQVSSYLGWSSQDSISWCLIGDLTALYDLAALGLASSSQKQRIIVMNNSGGRIFDRLFKEKKYLNPQTVQFSAWATMWGWEYRLVTSIEHIESLCALINSKVIIEVQPDNDQSHQFWQAWDHACRN